MAHLVTERDGMFTVREPAWHYGETQHHIFEDYPSREEAQSIAHPWEPITEPLYRRVPQVDEDGQLVEHYEEVPDRGVARSDDGAYLGAVSSTLEVIKNSEMYDIAEAIEGADKGSVKFETGGSLDGGRKVWLLLRLSEPLMINGDPNGGVIPYFALQNGVIGNGAFRGQATMTRIVCDNTSQMADLDAQARGTEFVFRKTKNVRERIEEAKIALAGWRESVQTFRLMSEHLIDLAVTPEQRATFVEQFIPMPASHTVSKRVVSNVENDRQKLVGILNGPTCEGINGTAYGLVQGSVEYLNHYRKAKSAESRFKRAYLDRNTIVKDAVDLALEVTHS